MSDRRLDDDAPFEALSALVDGEATPLEVARACTAWRDDAKVRAHWSTYQLIGDVMRSDEMAEASGSADFLKSFRARLSQEPVILAPAGLTGRAQPMVVDVAVPQLTQVPLRRRVWAGPMAVAACFVMIVGALVTNQGGLGGGSVNPGDRMALVQTFPSGGMALASLAGIPSSTDSASASFTQGAISPSDAQGAAWRDSQLEQVLQGRHGATQDRSFESRDGVVRPVGFEAP